MSERGQAQGPHFACGKFRRENLLRLPANASPREALNILSPRIEARLYFIAVDPWDDARRGCLKRRGSLANNPFGRLQPF
jgi:hypothetical protein